MSDNKLLEVQAAEKVEREYAEESFQKAKDFFLPSIEYLTEAPDVPSQDSIASKEGSIQFHLIGHKPSDPAYDDLMNQNADILLAMGGLVYNHMQSNYREVNKSKLSINTWNEVISNLPALALGTSVNKSYNNNIAGVQVSAEFLSLVARAIITEGVSLLVDFQSFLRSMGDIVFSGETKDQEYKILTCTYQNYLVANGVGGYYDYGAIVLKEINYLQKFLELKGACTSAKFVSVSMKYAEIVTPVHTRVLRKGGALYQDFQDLVGRDSAAQLNKAKNFFNAPKVPQKDLTPKV
ncbi:MAG TPA: hypothetical protein DCL61_13250 [Cyanobacteria bacterium UBA12227]|nr:hypothetical protein [Cyanobacteria bacterium UBA12227]